MSNLKSIYIKVFSIVAIVFLGVIVYSNTFLYSFHFDDDLYIINNFAIRNIQNLLDIWKICPCRFITFLSIALNYHFQQLNVSGYHLFNIAIHLGSACFVWWLVLMTFSTPAIKAERISQHANIISLLAGLIFVSHPIQIEAVTHGASLQLEPIDGLSQPHETYVSITPPLADRFHLQS